MPGSEVSRFKNSCTKNGFCYTELENYFFDRLEKIVNSLKKKRRMVCWQEFSDNNKPDPNAIIHIWKGNNHQEIYEQAKNITAKGHQVIISACWYLNYIKYGADWRDEIAGSAPSNSRYYYCDPANFTGSEEQKKFVLGGIVAIWGEIVDNTNINQDYGPVLRPLLSVSGRLRRPQKTPLMPGQECTS